MADPDRDERSQQEQEYVKGGKGRKDEVGGSGIYPASSPNAPADAAIRNEGDLVAHKGPRSKSRADKRSRTDDNSGSE